MLDYSNQEKQPEQQKQNRNEHLENLNLVREKPQLNSQGQDQKQKLFGDQKQIHYQNYEFDSTLQLQQDNPLGLTMIPDNQNNQILQLNLFPNQKIYIRGRILYSNAKISHIQRKWAGQGDIITFMKEYYASRGFMMRKIHNGQDHVVYLAVTSLGGKILVIDNNVYDNGMYFRRNNIIMSTACHQNAIIKKHTKFSGFQNWLKASDPQNIQRTVFALQSKTNCNIIEKYLAPNQFFYVKQELILCLSQSVQVTKQLLESHHTPVKLQGPGWIFIQTSLQNNSFMFNNKIGFFSLFLLLTFIGIILEAFQV